VKEGEKGRREDREGEPETGKDWIIIHNLPGKTKGNAVEKITNADGDRKNTRKESVEVPRNHHADRGFDGESRLQS
jgi:hypothetical protein